MSMIRVLGRGLFSYGLCLEIALKCSFIERLFCVLLLLFLIFLSGWLLQVLVMTLMTLGSLNELVVKHHGFIPLTFQ